MDRRPLGSAQAVVKHRPGPLGYAGLVNRRAWCATVLLIAGAACGRDWEIFTIQEEGTCLEGLDTCGDTCVDLTTSADHCGACDNPCAPTEICAAGTCEVSCGLEDFDEDPWGVRWEKLNSGPSTLDEAMTRCADVGARLPTVSETARAITAGVVDAVGGARLWTIVPASPTQQMVVSVDDAANPANVAQTADRLMGSAFYRCVCASADTTDLFTDAACEREGNQSCLALPEMSGVARNIDARDRASMPKQAALWECQFHGASLLHWLGQEAIRSDVMGSTAALWTGSSLGQFEGSLVLALQGDDSSVFSRINSREVQSNAHFRCVGPTNDTVREAPALANAWRPPASSHVRGVTLASEEASSAASQWLDAVRVCANRGGHLPSVDDLASLSLAGLTSSEPMQPRIWTTNIVAGLDTPTAATFYLTDPGSAFDWEAAVGSADRQEDRGFRCITYPLFDMPAEPPCNGDCVAVAFPNTEILMWIDGADRGAALFSEAVHTCATAGGRLASERDLVEMMHLTDVAGSGEWLQTSTITNLASQARVRVLWMDPKSYSGELGIDMDVNMVGAADPYRCVWSNELR